MKSPFYKTGVSKSPLFDKGHKGDELKNHHDSFEGRTQIKNKNKKRNKYTERMTYMKKRDVPDATDSLAVYMTRDARENKQGESNWAGVSDAAEKRYGKIDLSNYNLTRTTHYNMVKAKQKYNLPIK